MKQLIKLFLGIIITSIALSCHERTEKIGGKISFQLDEQGPLASSADTLEISNLLDSLNVAAAHADFNKYFSFFAEDATYNGTDATENWSKKTFMAWAKPYFEGKTTWHFKSVKRNIFFGSHDDIAWFEELLSTPMKICRGSGIVVKRNNKWKIQQYVLSMTVPNSKLDKVVELKTADEDALLQRYK